MKLIQISVQNKGNILVMLLFSLLCCHEKKFKGQRTHRKNSALYDFPFQASWKSHHLLEIHVRDNVGNGRIQATEKHGGRPEKKKKPKLIPHPFAFLQCGPEISQWTLQIFSLLHHIIKIPFPQIYLTVPDVNPGLCSCSLSLVICVSPTALSLVNLFAVFIDE